MLCVFTLDSKTWVHHRNIFNHHSPRAAYWARIACHVIDVPDAGARPEGGTDDPEAEVAIAVKVEEELELEVEVDWSVVDASAEESETTEQRVTLHFAQELQVLCSR